MGIFWSPKPPPGPLSKTAESVYVVLGIVMIAAIIVFDVWLGYSVATWLLRR
jgi:hypothetical protein